MTPYFFVVITSYNNRRWYRKNLSSLLSQSYPHWHALYIDDASLDETATLVEKWLKKKRPSQKGPTSKK